MALGDPNTTTHQEPVEQTAAACHCLSVAASLLPELTNVPGSCQDVNTSSLRLSDWSNLCAGFLSGSSEAVSARFGNKYLQGRCPRLAEVCLQADALQWVRMGLCRCC